MWVGQKPAFSSPNKLLHARVKNFFLVFHPSLPIRLASPIAANVSSSSFSFHSNGVVFESFMWYLKSILSGKLFLATAVCVLIEFGKVQANRQGGKDFRAFGVFIRLLLVH